MSLLRTIRNPRDLDRLSHAQLTRLAREIRAFVSFWHRRVPFSHIGTFPWLGGSLNLSNVDAADVRQVTH